MIYDSKAVVAAEESSGHTGGRFAVAAGTDFGKATWGKCLPYPCLSLLHTHTSYTWHLTI